MDTKKFKSLEEFETYQPKSNNNKIKVLIGMGSCGIAAGADRVYKKFKDEINIRDLNDIEIKKVGCMGLCYSEPNVEIKIPGLPDVLYGKVDENFTIRIIEEHILENRIINHNIFDKPYIDIFKL